MSHRVPKYRKHHTGQARVVIRGKTYYLGKYGTPESRQLYKTLLNEHLTDAGRFAPQSTPNAPPVATTVPSINELVCAYLEHCSVYYSTNAKEYEKVKLSTRPLRKLHGRTPIAAFDTLALEAVQNAMIDSDLARTTINERIRVLKRMFKWGVRKKKVPAGVFGELLTVEGLKRGRTSARETNPVKPVPLDHVEAVIAKVNRHVAAMIRLQLLTGARSGEICILRRADIDMTGAVWVYRPTKHKNQYRGQSREIYLGPQAQEITPWTKRRHYSSRFYSKLMAVRCLRPRSTNTRCLLAFAKIDWRKRL